MLGVGLNKIKELVQDFKKVGVKNKSLFFNNELIVLENKESMKDGFLGAW